MGSSADLSSSCWHESDAFDHTSVYTPPTRLPRLKIASTLSPALPDLQYALGVPGHVYNSSTSPALSTDRSLEDASSSSDDGLSDSGLDTPESEAPELVEDDGESPPYNPQLLSPVSPELSPEWSTRRMASEADSDGEPTSKAMLLSSGHPRAPYAYGPYDLRRDIPIYDHDPYDHAREHSLVGYDDQYAYYPPHLQPLPSDLFEGSQDPFPLWSEAPPDSPALRSTASLPELDFGEECESEDDEPPPSPARSLVSLPGADGDDDMAFLVQSSSAFDFDAPADRETTSPSPRSDSLLLLDDAPEDQSRSPSPDGPFYLPLPDEGGDVEWMDPELRRLCDIQRRAQAAEWEGRQKEAVLLEQGLMQARAEVKRQRKKDKERAREAAALIRLKLASGVGSAIDVPSPPPPSSKKAAASSASQLVARMLLRRHDTTRPISHRHSQAAHVSSPLAIRTREASRDSDIESLPLTLRLLDS